MLYLLLLTSVAVNLVLIRLYLLRKARNEVILSVFNTIHGDSNFDHIIAVLEKRLRDMGAEVYAYYNRSHSSRTFEPNRADLSPIPVLERSSFAKAFFKMRPLRLEQANPIDREVMEALKDRSLSVVPIAMMGDDSCWKMHNCQNKTCRCHGRHLPRCWEEAGRSYRRGELAKHHKKIEQCLGCRSLLPVGFFLVRHRRPRTLFRFINDNFGGPLRTAVLYENAVIEATRDGLTGLNNKKQFTTEITHHYALAHRHKFDLSLVMFDIDHFKKVNDTYGHRTGDLILKELAAIVAKAVRTTDIAARYGGEEFAVVLPNTPKDTAVLTAEKLRKAVENHEFKSEAHGVLKVTISMGVSSSQRDECTGHEDLIQKADMALYHSKHNGRNRVTAYSNSCSSMPVKIPAQSTEKEKPEEKNAEPEGKSQPPKKPRPLSERPRQALPQTTTPSAPPPPPAEMPEAEPVGKGGWKEW